jgi:hypothetical protein
MSLSVTDRGITFMTNSKIPLRISAKGSDLPPRRFNPTIESDPWTKITIVVTVQNRHVYRHLPQSTGCKLTIR